MTAQEVVWFFNHRYGEKAYIVETNNEINIFTMKSKWKIIKSDFPRFHYYTLFHYNLKSKTGYHKQMSGRTTEFLTFVLVFTMNQISQVRKSLLNLSGNTKCIVMAANFMSILVCLNG